MEFYPHGSREQVAGRRHLNRQQRLKPLFFIVLLLFYFLSISSAGYASMGYAPMEHTQTEKQHHVREEKSNIASIFLGDTTTQGQNLFTYGLEYHRIISFPFGIAAIYENTPKNIERRSESEVYALFTWNIPYNFMVGVGPGWRFEKTEPSTYLTRLKLGYILLLPGNIEIMPNVNYDFNKDVPAEWVTGISIGKQF